MDWMNWCIQHFNPLSSTIGLIFDIFGAWLVAWEVVEQYKGAKFTTPESTMEEMTDRSSFPPAKENTKYKIYEKEKYRKMKCGLIFLTSGFILQIVPNVRQILMP